MRDPCAAGILRRGRRCRVDFRRQSHRDRRQRGRSAKVRRADPHRQRHRQHTDRGRDRARNYRRQYARSLQRRRVGPHDRAAAGRRPSDRPSGPEGARRRLGPLRRLPGLASAGADARVDRFRTYRPPGDAQAQRIRDDGAGA